MDCNGPETYKEALTNIKSAIFKENYLEKLIEKEEKLILEKLNGWPLRSFRLEGDSGQQSGQ
jgi:hypothetical protein